MAHIPMGEISRLWNELPQHTWQALHQAIAAHTDQADGISNDLIDLVLRLTKGFEREGKPFPGSQDQLYEELNRKLHQV